MDQHKFSVEVKGTDFDRFLPNISFGETHHFNSLAEAFLFMLQSGPFRHCPYGNKKTDPPEKISSTRLLGPDYNTLMELKHVSLQPIVPQKVSAGMYLRIYPTAELIAEQRAGKIFLPILTTHMREPINIAVLAYLNDDNPQVKTTLLYRSLIAGQQKLPGVESAFYQVIHKQNVFSNYLSIDIYSYPTLKPALADLIALDLNHTDLAIVKKYSGIDHCPYAAIIDRNQAAVVSFVNTKIQKENAPLAQGVYLRMEKSAKDLQAFDETDISPMEAFPGPEGAIYLKAGAYNILQNDIVPKMEFQQLRKQLSAYATRKQVHMSFEIRFGLLDQLKGANYGSWYIDDPKMAVQTFLHVGNLGFSECSLSKIILSDVLTGKPLAQKYFLNRELTGSPGVYFQTFPLNMPMDILGHFAKMTARDPSNTEQQKVELRAAVRSKGSFKSPRTDGLGQKQKK
ncbi:hypothetical protein PV783_13740 [Chitinophaga sp. CC14]|uniref:hypothetical protein n=1 Tax=Chitinophaga sp. CC14 TaxID=3029199 RepID=UPI003B7FEB2F